MSNYYLFRGDLLVTHSHTTQGMFKKGQKGDKLVCVYFNSAETYDWDADDLWVFRTPSADPKYRILTLLQT